MKLKLVGLDLSLRNFGYAIASYDVLTEKLTIVDLVLVETKPADKKTKKVIRQNFIDLEAARDQYLGMIQNIPEDSAFVIAEVPVGSQNARSMLSCGLCIGILGSCNKPLIPVTPTEVKKAGHGAASATKEEMIEWAVAKHPEAPWLRVKSTGAVLGKNEHLADAVAAIYAGMQTPTLQAALAMARQMVGK